MSKNFEKVDNNYSEVSVDVEPNASDPFRDSRAAIQEAPVYDDDHPPPLSLNPADWIRDIRNELSSFSWELTERNRIV
jgi:hypothetical protein